MAVDKMDLAKKGAGAPLNLLSPGVIAQLKQAVSQEGQPQKSLVQVTSGSGVSFQVLSSSGPITATVPSQGTSKPYTYKVKIISPIKKKDVVIRHLNHFTSKFTSVTALRVQLIEEFKDHVPSSVDFNVGYFETKTNQQSKVWLVTSEDLNVMYKKFPVGSSIMLWCDGKGEFDTCTKKRKRDSDKCSGKRQEQEEEVESYYKDLVGKHNEMYTTPQYRLWARMYAAGIHDSMQDPPDIPAFSSNPPKRQRKDSFAESLTGAAIAFANTLSSSSQKDKFSAETGHNSCEVGTSPRKTVELRMKNYEQLRYLQQLFDDKILNENEYKEQKEGILKSLRNL